MRTLVDVRCEKGHVIRDMWVSLPVNLDDYGCTKCLLDSGGESGGRLTRADAPAISPNGIPADREIDIPQIPKTDTAAIARATAAEIEEKWNRFSDPKVAEEVVGREVDEHIHDPLPEVPALTFAREQNLDATVVAPIAG